MDAKALKTRRDYLLRRRGGKKDTLDQKIQPSYLIWCGYRTSLLQGEAEEYIKK